MSEWISAGERVPPKREEDAECTVDVLVWTCGRNMLAACYIYDDAEWYDLSGDMISDVTHWSELPPPPNA